MDISGCDGQWHDRRALIQVLPAAGLVKGTITEPGQPLVFLKPFKFDRSNVPFGRSASYAPLWRRDGKVYARLLIDNGCDENRDPDCGDLGWVTLLVVWDASSGRLLGRWWGHLRSPVLSSIRFIGDRYILLTQYGEPHQRLIDYGKRPRRPDWPICAEAGIKNPIIEDGAFDDAGNRAVVRNGHNAILVRIDNHTCRRSRWSPGASDVASATALSPDGRTVAIATSSGNVVLEDWDTDKAPMSHWRGPEAAGFHSPAKHQAFLRFSSDGRFLLYLAEGGLDILNLQSEQWIRVVPIVEPDGNRTLLVIDDEGHVDGDEAALTNARFRLGQRHWTGLSAVEAAGVPSPRVKGLLKKVLQSDDGAGRRPSKIP